MANKRMKEIIDLTQAELAVKIRETQSKLFDLKIKSTTGQLEKTADLWKARKELSRLKTALTQKNTSASAQV